MCCNVTHFQCRQVGKSGWWQAIDTIKALIPTNDEHDQRCARLQRRVIDRLEIVIVCNRQRTQRTTIDQRRHFFETIATVNLITTAAIELRSATKPIHTSSFVSRWNP
jgi:hypothetical protein